MKIKRAEILIAILFIGGFCLGTFPIDAQAYNLKIHVDNIFSSLRQQVQSNHKNKTTTKKGIVIKNTNEMARNSVPAVTESPLVAITGYFSTLHEDNIKKDILIKNLTKKIISSDQNIYRYFITDSVTYKKYEVFYQEDIEVPNFNGSLVRIEGSLHENNITTSIDGTRVIAPSPISTSSAKKVSGTVGELPNQRSMYVFLINMYDTPEAIPVPKVSRGDMETALLNGNVEDFYREQSYGKISNFIGTVSPWINVYNPDASCHNGMEAPEVEAYATAHGVDLSAYDQLMFVVNCKYAGLSGSSHLGPVTFVFNGTPYTMPYLNMYGKDYFGIDTPDHVTEYYTASLSYSVFDYLFAHELGHSLGLPHARGIDCGNVSMNIPSECTKHEYGNYFDVMGNGAGYSLQFSAYFKSLLGWVGPDDIVRIDSDGAYIIGDNYSSSGDRVAIIDHPTLNEIYTLEYRSGEGYDHSLRHALLKKNTEGVFIHQLTNPPLSRSHDLVDAHPTNSLWEFDAKEQSTLNKTSGLISSGSASSKISSPGVGGVFQDTYRGISIDNITTFIDTDGSKKVKFDVNFEAISCVREDPFIVARNDFSKDTIPKYSLGVESIKLNFQIINNDSPACAGTTFLVESEISALGLSASITTGVIAPFYITYGGLFTYDVSSVSSVYGPGMYSINTTITNTSSGLQTHKTFQFELVSSGSSPL